MDGKRGTNRVHRHMMSGVGLGSVWGDQGLFQIKKLTGPPRKSLFLDHGWFRILGPTWVPRPPRHRTPHRETLYEHVSVPLSGTMNGSGIRGPDLIQKPARNVPRVLHFSSCIPCGGLLVHGCSRRHFSLTEATFFFRKLTIQLRVDALGCSWPTSSSNAEQSACN